MVWVYAVIAATLIGFGGWGGYRFMDGKVERMRVERDAASVERDAANASAHRWQEARDREVITVKTVTQYVDRVVKLQGETRDVIKEIPVKIGCTEVDGTAMLAGAWRLSHDAGVSLANGTARTPYEPGKTLEAVAATVAVETVIENYATCRENAIKLTSLQDWVKAQQAAQQQSIAPK